MEDTNNEENTIYTDENYYINENNNNRKGKYLREVTDDFGRGIGLDVGFLGIFIYIMFLGPYIFYRLIKDKTIPCILCLFVVFLIAYSINVYTN